MTTPKRPSLADTLARIDAAIADHAAKLDAQPPCLRCARKSLIDSPFCAYHLAAGPEPVVRDGNTFTVTQPGVYQIGGSVHPYSKPAAPAPPHLPGPPGPTCPGCAARDARPGRLTRALRRLFGGAS